MPLEIGEVSEETGVKLGLKEIKRTKDLIAVDILKILEQISLKYSKFENIKYLGENLFFVSEIKEDIHKPVDSFEIDMSTSYGKFLLLNSKGELEEIYNEKRIIWAKLIEGVDNDGEKYILTFRKVNNEFFEGFLKYKEGKITQFISNISKSIPHDKEKIISELSNGNPVYIQFRNGEKYLVLMKNGETYYLNLEKYFPDEELGENITKKIQIKDNGVYILKNKFEIQNDIIYSNGIKGLIKIIINGKNITIEDSLNELNKYYDLVELETLQEGEVLGNEINTQNEYYLNLLGF